MSSQTPLFDFAENVFII